MEGEMDFVRGGKERKEKAWRLKMQGNMLRDRRRREDEEKQIEEWETEKWERSEKGKSVWEINGAHLSAVYLAKVIHLAMRNKPNIVNYEQ